MYYGGNTKVLMAALFVSDTLWKQDVKEMEIDHRFIDELITIHVKLF